MKDTYENIASYVQFAAQEIINHNNKIKEEIAEMANLQFGTQKVQEINNIDEKLLPHLSKEALILLIRQGKRKALLYGHPNALTLRLRYFRDCIRKAGDLAWKRKKELIDKEDMLKAFEYVRSSILEKNIADSIETIKMYSRKPKNKGYKIGTVNGLSIATDPVTKEPLDMGFVVPVHVTITPYYGEERERVEVVPVALDEAAKGSVVVFKAIMGQYCKGFLKNKKVTIQYENQWQKMSGPSATIDEIVAGLSAASGIPVRQDTAMTGAANIDEHVKYIGGTVVKINSAIEAGIRRVLVPKENYRIESKFYSESIDLYREKQMEIIPVENISQVLYHALYFDFNFIKKPPKNPMEVRKLVIDFIKKQG
jgi:Lon-like ATP-dependent protease